MAFRKAPGVEMESAAAMPVSGACNAVGSRRCSPRVSGIGRARVESERDIGRSARRRELELRLSSRLVIVGKLERIWSVTVTVTIAFKFLAFTTMPSASLTPRSLRSCNSPGCSEFNVVNRESLLKCGKCKYVLTSRLFFICSN
jgi:hypothetical protein